MIWSAAGGWCGVCRIPPDPAAVPAQRASRDASAANATLANPSPQFRSISRRDNGAA
jgi:hypothetical protein